MAKGFQDNKVRLEDLSFFGKAIGKQACYKFKWCESKDAFEQRFIDDSIKERHLFQSQICI